AAEKSIDGGVPRGHRMAPGGVLPRREAHRREREGHLVHAQLRVHQHVEMLLTDYGSDRRRKCITADKGAHAFGATVDCPGNRVVVVSQGVETDFKAIAIEVGEPTRKIKARGAFAQKRRYEADANPASANGFLSDRRPPRWIGVIKGAREYRRIACLEITIVFALVGEKE